MGVPVVGFDDFKRKLKRVRRNSVVFGFLLYDSRSSQRQIAEFAEQHSRWIDELARGAGIYFFFPLRRSGTRFDNPSPEVMRSFGLGVSRLPGIVLFAPPRSDGSLRTEHAVYLPLEERDFISPAAYEPILADLFDLIRECLSKNRTSHETLVSIQGEIGGLRRRRVGRGFARWLRKGAHTALFRVPSALYEPVAAGFGRAVGDRIAGP